MKYNITFITWLILLMGIIFILDVKGHEFKHQLLMYIKYNTMGIPHIMHAKTNNAHNTREK